MPKNSHLKKIPLILISRKKKRAFRRKGDNLHENVFRMYIKPMMKGKIKKLSQQVGIIYLNCFVALIYSRKGVQDSNSEQTALYSFQK